MKLMKRILNYSLLCIPLLNGMNCFGMEQKEDNKENVVVKKELDFSKIKRTQTKNILYHQVSSGFLLENTTVKLESDEGCPIAEIEYLSMNNIPDTIKYLQRIMPIEAALRLIPGGRDALMSYVMSLAQGKETIRNGLPEVYKYANQGFSLLNEHNSIVFITLLKVTEEYKNQGIGSRLGTYMFLQVIKQEPNTLLCWLAVPLDGKEKKEDLFRLYRNFGATVTQDGLAWLDTKKYHESLKTWGIVPIQQSKI